MKAPLAAILLACLIFTGCNAVFGPRIKGSGVMRSEDRQVGPYSRLKLRGSGDVSIQVGGTASLRVDIDDNLQEYIQTEVRNGELTIESTEKFDSELGLQVVAVTPTLESISVSGAGNIDVADVDQSSFVVNVTGSGDIRADGRCDLLEISVTGSGDIDLGDLVCAEATIDIAGSGTVTVNASDALAVKITGSGDVKYFGDPKVNRRITGSGDIQQIGASPTPSEAEAIAPPAPQGNELKLELNQPNADATGEEDQSADEETLPPPADGTDKS